MPSDRLSIAPKTPAADRSATESVSSNTARPHEGKASSSTESLVIGPDQAGQNGPIALMRAKTRKGRSRKVLNFDALKRAQDSDKKGQPHLPSRGQPDENWLKTILPSLGANAWWEVPADDQGFKIKIRWRAEGKKLVYTFRRVGKHELKTLMEKTYEQQRRIVQDRLIGELIRKRRPDIAARFEPLTRNDQIAGGEAS